MSEFVALLWDRTQWVAAEVSASLGSVRLLNTAREAWPEKPSLANSPTEVGAWFKSSLIKAGIRARTVWLIVPREDVILRHLELPMAPDEELPDLVRFQATTRSAVSLDQLLLDFLPIAHRGQQTRRDALCVTAPMTLLGPVRTVLEAAGCELAGVTISSLAIAELIAHVAHQQKTAAADGLLGVISDGQRVEIVVQQQRQLLYGHVARLPSDPAAHKAAVLSECARAIVAAQRLESELVVRHGWLVADPQETAEWLPAMAERLDCPVKPLQPIADTGLSSTRALTSVDLVSLAAPLGFALGRHNQPKPALDLLHPRKAPPRRDPRKAKIAAGAAAALLIVAGATSWTELSLMALDTEIADLKTRDGELARELKAGQPRLVAASDVQNWLSRSQSQLGLFEELYGEMSGTSQQYLTQFDYNTGANDVLGRVAAIGNARSGEAVRQVQDQIDARLGRRVKPKPLTIASRDTDYPTKFELDMDLIVEAEKKPAKPAPAKPAAAPVAVKP